MGRFSPSPGRGPVGEEQQGSAPGSDSHPAVVAAHARRVELAAVPAIEAAIVAADADHKVASALTKAVSSESHHSSTCTKIEYDPCLTSRDVGGERSTGRVRAAAV